MAQAIGGYSSYPNFVKYVIDASIVETDPTNNRTRISLNAYVYVTGSSASSSGGSGDIYVNGVYAASGSVGYWSLGKYGTQGVTSNGSFWVSHDNNGYIGSVTVSGSSSMSGLGSVSISTTLDGFQDYTRSPSTPSTPSFVSRDRSSITMTTSSSVPSGAPGISSYTWQSSTNNVDWTTISGQTTSTLSWTSASATTQYYFRALATNTEGSSSYSSSSAFISAAPSQPSPPTLSRSGLGVSVGLNTPNSNGSTLSTFTLQYAKDSGFTTDLQTVSNISSSTTPVSSLTPGTTYYFRYKVGSNRGDSDYSASSNIAIPSIPSAPTITTALTKQVRKVTVDWDAPSLSGGATVSSYELEARYSSDGGANWDTSFTQIASTSSTATVFTTLDLNIAKTYQFRVRAVTDVGNTAYSDTTALTEYNSIFISAYGYKYDGTNFNTAIQYAARYTGDSADSITANGTTYPGWKVIENVKKFDGTDLIPLSQ
jgi:hypothetical protein